MKKYIFLMLMTFVLVLAGCSESEELDTTSDKIEQNENNADNQDGDNKVTNRKTVELKNSDDEKAGSAVLEQEENGVKVSLKVEGMEPGKHGVHFHETAKCEGPDFESAGAHFNPDDTKHGVENDNGPHAGDLPNIEVAEDGTGEFEFTTEYVSLLADKENSLLDEDGSALVVHDKEDDGKTDPSGDSGDRIACGVLE
ncbi:hypothetical protein AC622_19075 [Bacillus sp. FJAT-27916]|uniref:superoxide dismutase family protein n=1 Tax=Bacillus sp. FJAT-27916 TaxID=1679169 RepID=UPI0006710B23|nr:superoxide dismutase family protein [Bacillus sp. FJAT-27916]KMY46032.1 hypothetical protein AC622_19075 [Bacillus sp. FJAT-27916]